MPEHTPAPTPSRAVYGFVMYLSLQIFFILYIFWAVMPEEWLVSVGITFLPQKYWAVAVPVYFLTVLTVFAFLIYPGLGFYMTPEIDDMNTVRDRYGKKLKNNGVHSSYNESTVTKCLCKNEEQCSRAYYESIRETLIDKSIPVLQDLEMWDVSDNLYMK